MTDDGGFDPSRTFVYRTGVERVPWKVVRAAIDPSVTSIPDGLFDDCDCLEEVTFHGGLTGIGERAFFGCSSLQAFQFPPKVRKIGRSAFWGCWSLSEVELPPDLESVEDRTFARCWLLGEIRIPASVARIGGSAFRGCTNLALVELREGLRWIGKWAFESCSSLGSLRIPLSVGFIGEHAFGHCRNLTSVQLHEYLEEVFKNAFEDCPLTTVTFVRLSERREVIRMDARARSMFDDKLNRIATAMKQGDFDWNECKESLRRAHDVLDHWEELDEAATMLELAQWKIDIEEEGGGRADVIDNDRGGQNPGVAPRGQKRRRESAREERRVPRGAGIVTKQALKFLAHSKTWE